MEKEIFIKVGVEGSKILNAIKTSGYDDNSISDQLELLGLMENLKTIIQSRIIKLQGINGKYNDR
jgi:hypothetical protein